MTDGGVFTAEQLDTSVVFQARRRLSGEAGLRALEGLLRDFLAWEPARQRQRNQAAQAALEAALSAILANLILARRNAVSRHAFVAVSFDGNRYTGTGLSLTPISAVRDFLLSAGLIEGQRGYQKREQVGGLLLTAHARQTRLRATNKLVGRLEDAGVDLKAPYGSPGSAVGWAKRDGLVRMTDPEPGMDGEPADIAASRATIKTTNRLIAEAELGLPEDAWARIHARMHAKGADEVMDRMAAGDVSRVELYRKFKGGWSTGGRLYGGWWQTVPRAERRHLTIDGQPTVELDYARLHPTLLYAERGLSLQFDPYLLPSITNPSVREVGKRTFNRLLNGSTCLLKAQGDDHKQLGSVITFADLLAGLIALHEPIADAFGTRAGLRLQRLDSDILLGVLSRLNDAGVVALPIHDSVIVSEDQEQLLRASMEQAYLDRVGSPSPPVCLQA